MRRWMWNSEPINTSKCFSSFEEASRLRVRNLFIPQQDDPVDRFPKDETRLPAEREQTE